MISLDDFSHLLKVLYSTPLQPDAWNEFLELLVKHTGSASAFLLVADRRQSMSIRMEGGVSFGEERVRLYAQELSAVDPYRIEAIRRGKLGVVDMAEWVPLDDLKRMAVYRHLLEPVRIGTPVAMVLSCSLTRMEGISVWRHPEQGRMSKDDWRLMELLFPHVQAVLDVRRKLGAIHEQLKTLEAVADASPSPALLVGPTGKLLHANAAARELLEKSDGLRLTDGKVRAVHPSADTALSDLLQRVADSGVASGAVGTSGMLLPRDGERPMVQVLASTVPAKRLGNKGSVLLVLSDPEKPVLLPEDAMRDLYGMTAAEVEVASGLLTGYSLDEIAILRKVAIGTVRMQLKSIFSKTKTHKQAELVALLMRMPGVR